MGVPSGCCRCRLPCYAFSTLTHTLRTFLHRCCPGYGSRWLDRWMSVLQTRHYGWIHSVPAHSLADTPHTPAHITPFTTQLTHALQATPGAWPRTTPRGRAVPRHTTHALCSHACTATCLVCLPITHTAFPTPFYPTPDVLIDRHLFSAAANTTLACMGPPHL